MEVIRELAALALVFGLLGASLWFLRSKGALRWKQAGRARKESRRLESLDRLALSPQHALHLIRVADRMWLLVTHAGGCTLLSQLPLSSPEDGSGAPLTVSAAALNKVLS